MAYLQTTATSIDDILNTIATFANGLGWTVERNNTYTSGSNNRRILSLSLPGFDYAHFYTELSTSTAKVSLYTLRSMGLAVSGDYTAIPQKSVPGWTWFLTGNSGPYVNLWLFGEAGSNPYIHCVVEYTAGRYRHFGIGDLVKDGTWTGGAYNYGTAWDPSGTYAHLYNASSHEIPFREYANSSSNRGSVRCNDSDYAANNISGVDNNYLPYYIGGRRVMTGHALSGGGSASFEYVNNCMGVENFCFSDYNQRTSLVRLKHFVSVAGGYFRLIGEPPAIRVININPFQAGEELTIGSDVWKVFPLVRKGYTANIESSEFHGLAYKKVV